MTKGRVIFKLMFFILALTVSFYVKKCFAQAGNYSAIVIDESGKVSVRHDGGKAAEANLQAGDVLYPGDIVKTHDKSSVTINYYLTGRQERWPGRMKFFVGSSETNNVPSGVEISTSEVNLPEVDFGDHTGDFMLKSVMPDKDFEETLPLKLDQQEEQTQDQEGER